MELFQTVLLVIILLLCAKIALNTFQKPRLKKSSQDSIVVDSSALIDGRLLNIAKAGFLSSRLVIPSSVLREMQYLADKSDSEKRSRARHGLDVVSELQKLPSLEVEIFDDGLPGEGGVDERLVQLCKTFSAFLITLDFNLNKVAAAEGVKVLNINELAQNLRISYLPGERRFITIVDKGQNKTQGVGYLEDGTMVVVEDSARQTGQQVEVEFTRAIQTNAGKMLFAKKLSKGSTVSNNTKTSYPKGRAKKSAEDKLVDLANGRNK